MGEYADYELSRWIRSGMKISKALNRERCNKCGVPERTVTGNFTWCFEVEGWHGKAFNKKEKPV